MPPPSLPYIQMLVTQLRTRDTRGVRRTPLRLQVSQTPLERQHNTTARCALAFFTAPGRHTSYHTMSHAQTQHARVTDTDEYLLTMHVLNCLHL